VNVASKEERAIRNEARRDSVVQEASLNAAREWAKAFRIELQRDGRRVAGGWPGTLSEARVRAGAEVGRALSQKSMAALTHDELARVARTTYDEARRAWRISLEE
jgi:hypothetical protein